MPELFPKTTPVSFAIGSMFGVPSLVLWIIDANEGQHLMMGDLGTLSLEFFSKKGKQYLGVKGSKREPFLLIAESTDDFRDFIQAFIQGDPWSVIIQTKIQYQEMSKAFLTTNHTTEILLAPGGNEIHPSWPVASNLFQQAGEA
jgi:hypothetical protein